MSEHLTDVEMAEIQFASMGNALRMVDDARLLLDHGRLEASFALTVLAAEEYGKSILVPAFYGLKSPSDQDWKDFWKNFKSHQFKLGNALHALWFAEADPTGPPANSMPVHLQRLAVLYVDYREGAVTTPMDAVSREDVERFLDPLYVEIQKYTKLLGSDVHRQAQNLSGMRDSDRHDGLRQLIADRDWDSVILLATYMSDLVSDLSATRSPETSSEALRPSAVDLE